IVGGNANLGGTLQVLALGHKFAYGQQFPLLQAGSISGQFDAITVTDPANYRARFLVNGGTGTLLIAPADYELVAQTQNQRNAAKALDSFIKAKSGDKQTVSTALDLLGKSQYASAFETISPIFYASLADTVIEQINTRAQMLAQRASAVRLGSRGFQAIGIESPLKYDKDGRSVMDAKDGKNILSPADDNKWGVWVQANGIFANAAGMGGVTSYNFENGGFLVGGDYRWSENFVTGVYGGYQGTYSKYNNGGVSTINGVDFGVYAGYQNGGFYTDAIIGGGSSSYAVSRPVKFSSVDRTAISRPDGAQFTSYLGLGYDWQAGNFTFGPVLTGQYTYAGIAPFTERGAGALDLGVNQQNASSLRTSLGGRVAYTWKVSNTIALIPEARLFWQHEFLENPRNIGSSLNGGGGPSFDTITSAPARDAVFAGAGISIQFGPNWNAYLYYNADFGRQDYISHSLSTGLNFKF
ncbi:MAG: autotransporter outer membrane beta-barrel domain-containing protein, partial [Verrucomicrobiota bacterium]